jgi:hypothetical protein
LNNYQEYLDLAAEDVANIEVEQDLKNPIFGVAAKCSRGTHKF